ncbi:MAG: head-tail connector protein [Eubacterium sp.]|nr:head-tail connector protein [Eubacterium sp.]
MDLFNEIPTESIYNDNMPEIIRGYLRDECVSDETILRYWKRAVSFIESYTGCEKQELDGKSEPVACCLALIADMHDNRTYQGERTYLNQLVDSMLFMYRKNFC